MTWQAGTSCRAPQMENLDFTGGQPAVVVESRTFQLSTEPLQWEPERSEVGK